MQVCVGGKPGKRGFLDRRVAIAAVNAKLARMVPVAEGNGLLARDVLIGVPGRQRNFIEREAQRAND